MEETVEEASVRVAKEETGLDTKFEKMLGYMEFPFEVRAGHKMHTVSIVIEMSVRGGELKLDSHSQALEFFKDTPENTVAEHAEFLKRESS